MLSSARAAPAAAAAVETSRRCALLPLHRRRPVAAAAAAAAAPAAAAPPPPPAEASAAAAATSPLPPLGSGRLRVATPPGVVLTSSVIARATNQTVDDLNMSAPGPDVSGLSRVAYQGVPGAYSEMAALRARPESRPLPCEQFEVAFQALSQWMAEAAVLPVENSLGGSIHAVYDLLLRYRLHIVGETSVAVNHCLMALPGTKMSEVKRAMSHPQALAQVDGYLRRLGVVREAVDDTAGAAQAVANGRLEGVAAVASRRAAELYGLEVLDEDIQDARDNVTRFIVLSRDPLVTSEAEWRQRPYKTSIVFSLRQGPGQLFKALSVFALRDIDMTKIESRPLRSNPLVTAAGPLSSSDEASNGLGSSGGMGGAGGNPPPPPPQQRFNYLFYIDFVGALGQPAVQNALRHLEEIAPFLRVLGSYPMDTELGALDSNRPDGLKFEQQGAGAALASRD